MPKCLHIKKEKPRESCFLSKLLKTPFCFYSFSLYGDEIDNVSPDSNDYETSKLDDEIYDPIGLNKFRFELLNGQWNDYWHEVW